MPSSSKNMVQGTVMMLIFMFFSALLGYALKFIFARYISVEEIGLFYSILGFVLFFSFLRDMGLVDSLTYFIPKYMIKGEKVKLKSTIIFSAIFQLSVSALFFLVIFLISGPLSELYFKDVRAKSLLIILAMYFLIDGILETLTTSFHGFKEFINNQSLEFIFLVLSNTFLSLAVLSGLSIVFLGYGYLLAGIITCIIFLFVFFKKTFPDFFRVKTKITKKFTKDLFSYAFPAMIGNLTIRIFNQQTILLLTMLAGLEAVGYYVMAYAIAKVSIYFYKAALFVFVPMITELWHKKDIKQLTYYFNQVMLFSQIIGLPIAMTLFILSEKIILVFFGEALLGATTILKILSIHMLVLSLSGIFKRIFLSIGMPKLSSKINLSLWAVNLVANLIFIPFFGVVGAGIADLISSIVGFIHSLRYNNKISKIKIEFGQHAKLIAITLFFGIMLLITDRQSPFPNDLHSIIFSGIISGPIYIALIFLFRLISLKKVDFILRQATSEKIKMPKIMMDNWLGRL